MERRALWSVAAIVTATAGAAVLPPVAAQAAPARPARSAAAAAPVNLIKDHGAEKARPNSGAARCR